MKLFSEKSGFGYLALQILLLYWVVLESPVSPHPNKVGAVYGKNAGQYTKYLTFGVVPDNNVIFKS